MFEIIDTVVTAGLTVMVYSVPALTAIAFIHFVVTHPVPAEATVQTVKEDNSSVDTDTQPAEQPIEQSEVTAPTTAVAEIVTEIRCEPVNWQAWRVADLRAETLRKLFNVQLRVNKKPCNRAQLISQYQQAIPLK